MLIHGFEKYLYLFIWSLQSLATKLGPTENVLISPFSVATVLAMAHAGAKGNTAIQLKNTLQLTSFPYDQQIFTTIGNLTRSVKVVFCTFIYRNNSTK